MNAKVSTDTKVVTRQADAAPRRVEADICVVGAGIAGTSAALTAARAGRRVVLLDGLPVLGGQAVNSIIGTFCGLFANGTHGHQFTHGIADEILRDLGRVDGFDQDEAESKRDERAVILRRLLASKCDTLEAFELADRLFDACPCLVECFRKEGGHILGVGSIRDCRTYSALARGVAI